MKKIIKNQDGFGVVEIILVVMVLGLIGFVGYHAYSQRHKTNNAQTTSTVSTTTPKKTETPKPTTTVDPNAGYLVVSEWGLRFKTPNGLADVRYKIQGDTLAFFAKPAGSSVQYRADYDKYEDGHFPYATGLLYRSNNTNNDRGFPTNGKKVGNYYYYTAWSFSSLATGAACLEIYGDSSDSNCQANAKAFQLVNQGDNALLNTIELAH